MSDTPKADKAADSGLRLTTCSRSSDAEKYAEPHGSKERVEEQLRIALDGHSCSDLWGENCIEQLDAALVARIKKWADWKQHPDDHLNGCDPKWYDGWITGKIEELQNVREMLLCLQSGKSMAWAIPSENSIYSPTRSWLSNRFFVGFIMGKDLWKCLVVNAALRGFSSFPRGRDCDGFPDELDRRDDWIWRFGVPEVLELEEIEYRILIFG